MSSLGDKMLSMTAIGVSAALSIRLFSGLASDLLSMIMMGALALCLEGGKLQAIRSWRRERKATKAGLVALLVALSLAASAGSALVVIEERAARIASNDGAQLRNKHAYEARLQQVANLEMQISSIVRKVDATPVEWGGTLKSLRTDLSELRQKEAQVLSALGEFRLGGIETREPQADIFRLLAQALGASEHGFLFAFLLLVAAAIEALIVLDFEPSETKGKEAKQYLNPTHVPTKLNTQRSDPALLERRRGRPRDPLDIEGLLPEFVRRIIKKVDARGFATASRETVAKEMGLTSWQGKTLYAKAVERGLISTRGHRTLPGHIAVSA